MRKYLKALLTVTVFITAVIFMSISANALTSDKSVQYQTENRVTLYSKTEYEGESAEYGIGEYPTIEISSASIAIPQEYVVYAYTGENFEGTEHILNESESSYFRYDFGKGLTKIFRIRSMKIFLIESEAIDISSLDDKLKNQIMTDYAPRIHMAQGDPYEAVSMDWTFENFERVMDDGVGRLVMKEKIDGPFDICETFYGDQESAVAYAFWIDKEYNYIDIVYFIYCPYDSGKYIWLLGTNAGGHPGDWEHFTLRFLTYEKNGKQYMRPVKAAFAAHTFAIIRSWEELEMYDDTHCSIYCAAGTHGLYPDTGTYVYVNLLIVQLKDECSEGEIWDLWEKGNLETFELVPLESCRALAGSKWASAFDYDYDNPDSLATYYWGNRSSYPPFMNGGPAGPQFKTEMTSTTSFK